VACCIGAKRAPSSRYLEKPLTLAARLNFVLHPRNFTSPRFFETHFSSKAIWGPPFSWTAILFNRKFCGTPIFSTAILFNHEFLGRNFFSHICSTAIFSAANVFQPQNYRPLS
jgi:hypothetical protein